MGYRDITSLRERAHRYGTFGLDRSEALSLTLGNPQTADALLELVDGDLTRLGDLSIEEIMAVKGIGKAKALALMAALEVGRRAAYRQGEMLPTITCADDVKNLVGGEMSLLEQEEMRVLLLNNKHEVIGIETLYKGTVNSASVRVAEVLRPAIRRQCPAILICHNHPSGDPTPSPEDVQITRRINQSAQLMDIELLDHIVIGHKGVVSMKSRQLGF